MRAINHAMTGAVIGLAVTNPVALPLAFASHYILDGIPHHGNRDLSNHTTTSFKVTLLIDILLCLALTIVLLLKHPNYWWLAAVCAFIGASPDFMWFSNFVAQNRGKEIKKKEDRTAIVRWHGQIQWFQKPIGLVIEIAWAVLAIVLLIYLIKIR